MLFHRPVPTLTDRWLCSARLATRLLRFESVVVTLATTVNKLLAPAVRLVVVPSLEVRLARTRVYWKTANICQVTY